MTPEKLHEAIGLLPSDLVTEADQQRNQVPKKKKSHWKQFAAMAACFAVVLACSLFLSNLGMGGSSKGAPMEMAAAEEPASVQQTPSMAMPENALKDEAAPMEGAAEEAAEAPRDYAAGNSSLSTDLALPQQFAVRLLKNSSIDGKNALVSPLSVFSALSMTANGAVGDTLAQMEDVLGMPLEGQKAWLGDCLAEENTALKLANAIWFTDDDRLTVHPGFAEDAMNTYRAEVNRAPMNADTCNAINRWVSEKTQGMIPTILEEIPEDAVMYLVNALAFEADWNNPYQEYQLSDGIFTTEDGRQQDVELMHSTEHTYFEDDLATGFRKSYKRGRYAFVALMPKEGVTVSQYLDSLTGEHLAELLENPVTTTVYAALPKFEAEFETELSDTLKAMGMTDAFDETLADFSSMGFWEDGNLLISQVRHKTRISVTEQGTKAGAATMVEMVMGTALVQDTKTVTLDRPFVYLILDMQTNYPIFMGTMMDMDA